MRYLINFCDYCFYRFCCFYKRHPMMFSNFAYGASTAIGVTHGLHILSLSVIWSAISGCKVNPTIISLGLMYYYDDHVYTYERYKLLARKYKREKNKKIKGWGVFLYILLSMLTIPILGVLLTGLGFFDKWVNFFKCGFIIHIFIIGQCFYFSHISHYYICVI